MPTSRAEKQATVFLSTHILPVVDDLADTVGVLYDGRLVAEGTPDGLKTRAEAERADGEDDESLEDVFLDITRDGEAPDEHESGRTPL